MGPRVVALVVVAAVIGAGCSSGESADSDENPSTTLAPSFVIGAQQTGTMTVTVEAADATSPIIIADRLDQLFSRYPGAKRASVDGTTVTGVVEEFPRDAAETFEFTMRSESIMSLQPVLGCADETGLPDPLPSDAEVLSGETVGECALGPSPLDGSPFIDAFVISTLDLQVSVTIDPEVLDEFNVLATACFEADPTCPSRQLAVVAGNDIVTAPLVNTPSLPEQIAITGDFSEDEAEGLATLIAGDRHIGEFASVQYDFVADT
jgi:preprotein translocase subunit SecD